MELGSLKLTWTKIGKYNDCFDFYLCDQIVGIMPFDDRGNEWLGSKVKYWLNMDFYRDSFSKEQRERIVGYSEAKSHVFLLSVEEYIKYRENIPLLSGSWWLRSPGDYTFLAATVDFEGDLFSNGCNVLNAYGVRPAILLRNTEV